jgi:hypothetical protein
MKRLTSKRSLGVNRVFITAKRIRRSNDTGVKSDTTPVFNIHGDATPGSGAELLQNSLKKMDWTPKNPPGPNGGRAMLINVWRPLKTITRDPLAFLNPNSMRPADRHVQIFERPPDTFKVFEKPIGNYWLDSVSYNEEHEWVFLEHQQPDEPVIFSQWHSDSVDPEKLEQRMSILHSCFVDGRYADEPPRASIELKMLAFFDE